MNITIHVEQRLMGLFSILTGYAFRVNQEAGCSLKELLCDRLGIAENYLDERIQTVFLNGKAIDDPETATVAPGASIALSAAMPGLVGATFRKGGYYAPMRREISHTETIPKTKSAGTMPELKLLNLIQKELGPIFLDNGIFFRSSDLEEFLRRHRETISPGLIQVLVNGGVIDADSLFQLISDSDKVFLKIKSE